MQSGENLNSGHSKCMSLDERSVASQFTEMKDNEVDQMRHYLATPFARNIQQGPSTSLGEQRLSEYFA